MRQRSTRDLSHPLGPEILARHMQFVPTIAVTKYLTDFLKLGGSRLLVSADVGTPDPTNEDVRQNIIILNLDGVSDNRHKIRASKGLRMVGGSVFLLIPT